MSYIFWKIYHLAHTGGLIFFSACFMVSGWALCSPRSDLFVSEMCDFIRKNEHLRGKSILGRNNALSTR